MQWHTGCSEWHCSCAGSFIQLQGFDLMSNALPTERHRGVLSNDHRLLQYTAANLVR